METGMISVDRWSQGSQAYFLTHLHADHTRGLTPTWKWGPLFCSRLTAKLFPSKFPHFKLSLLRVLDLGDWYSLPLFSPSSGLPTTVEVMAIDAHHCPGAVMYLFRGEFGYMLYTGDFRWEATSWRAQVAKNMLVKALKDEKLDNLYLDNTYCNPSYSFPSREVAARQVVDIITSHPDHDIVIGVDSLGKEDLLQYVSQMLKIKIWVWPERLQTMHLLGYQDIFTTKTLLTRVRAIPRYSFSIETLQGLNKMRPTIGIMPSGLPWAKNIFKGFFVAGKKFIRLLILLLHPGRLYPQQLTERQACYLTEVLGNREIKALRCDKSMTRRAKLLLVLVILIVSWFISILTGRAKLLLNSEVAFTL